MRCFRHITLRIATALFCLLFISVTQAQTADLVFSAPPREGGVAKSKAFYQPLADAIGKALGVKVVFKGEADFFNYGLQMRKGAYDIVFDGPHFGAWRMNQIAHEPIVSLPGSLIFNVIASKDRSDITDTDSLRTKRICGPASPNLATLSATNRFSDNMMRHPSFIVAQGGMKGTFKSLKKKRCDAAVLRNTFFQKKLKPEEREQYRVIFETTPLPNQTITAGPRLSSAQKQQLKDFLLSADGARGADKLLTRFSKKKKNFVPADANKFTDLDSLLIRLAWGWDGK